jgi:chromate transporter
MGMKEVENGGEGEPVRPPTFLEAFRFWLKLGFISFGGPTGQIAIMNRELVERRKWISDSHFLQALNFCMLLPGPEAQQLAIYMGWLLHSTWGGIVAGVLFVLPSVFLLWGLAWVYSAYGSIPVVAALFYGLKPAVVAIVAEAVIRIGKKSLRNELLLAMAALAFVGIYFLAAPFPLIVVSAGILGCLGGVWLPGKFVAKSPSGPSGEMESLLSQAALARMEGNPSGVRSLKVLALCLTLWFSPMAFLGLWRGWDDILVQIGILFSKAAVVTFGGAYAVLSYVGQQAVEYHGWLQPEQMMDGLGLAESTPGPLIMVNQFVGYVAAYHHAQGISPAVAGAVGGLVTTWVTFVPSFLWIFLGAPYIERLRGNPKLGAALSAITASVVGVVLNLAVNFAVHTVSPQHVGIDGYAVAASAAAFAALQFLKWPMIPVLLGSAGAGLLWRLFADSLGA